MTSPIIGESKQIIEIRNLIKNVADTFLNILITGETGVGKGVVAKHLHEASSRNNSSFVTVNCAALPETLLESELYGYSKGAFTGAHRARQGKFQMADKGVLFLDEIGDMPISLQSKILHVLQTGAFSPLGSDQEMFSDVWLIAATNHDLEAKIKQKQFRADLFYRLNIIKIEIPPLRERVEDIPLLVDYYISTYLERYPLREIQPPNQAVLDQLASFSWPGNIRQLQNIIKKQLVVNNWDVLLKELRVSEYGREEAVETPSSVASKGMGDFNRRGDDRFLEPSPEEDVAGTSDLGEKRTYHRRRKEDIPPNSILNEFLENGADLENKSNDFSLKLVKKKVVSRVEREVIGYVLSKTAWNRSKASKILKVSYKTLLTKIAELNLEPPS